jgi:hypothetical protein
VAAGAGQPGQQHVVGSRFGSAAAVLAIATDVLYLGIIASQDPVEWVRVTLVAGAILLAGAAAAVATLANLSIAIRLVLFAAAAGGLLSLGVLGLFSIGLPLFVAGILSSISWQRVWAGTGDRRLVPSLLAFVAAALVPFVAVMIP